MTDTTTPMPPTAQELGIIACHACGLVMRDLHDGAEHVCPRCDEAVHHRKTHHLSRAWSFLIAAAALYIPANVLPIMTTTKLPRVRHDTILSGVLHLWALGSWDLALIVFTASIVVPLLKIGALAMLLVTTGRGSTWHRRERTQLFRLIEFVGHWSMLDVFVVALLITLVQFGPFASVEAGPAIVPFGAVVILTMLASLSFDPRMIWERRPARAATVAR